MPCNVNSYDIGQNKVSQISQGPVQLFVTSEASHTMSVE